MPGPERFPGVDYDPVALVATRQGVGEVGILHGDDPIAVISEAATAAVLGAKVGTPMLVDNNTGKVVGHTQAANPSPSRTSSIGFGDIDWVARRERAARKGVVAWEPSGMPKKHNSQTPPNK